MNKTLYLIIILTCCLLISGCSKKSPVVEISTDWGILRKGLRTRLDHCRSSYSLGNPMPFRLNVKNFNDVEHTIEYSLVQYNNSLLITAPDGESCSYIAPTYQTAIETHTINPGETFVLFDEFDVSSQYFIGSPGRYTIRFAGQPPAYGDASLPPSNTLEFVVEPGTLHDEDAVVKRVLPLLDDDLRLIRKFHERIRPAGRKETRGFILYIIDPDKSKPEEMVLTLWFTDSRAESRATERMDVMEISTYVDESQWGYVYVYIPPFADDDIRELRARIIDTLEITR